MRTYKTDLSVAGVQNLKKEILNYKNTILPSLINQFVNELSNIGIQTAYNNLGQLNDLGNVSGLVLFYKTSFPVTDGYKAILYAKDQAVVKQFWLSGGSVKSADVSPLLMYEFGSGYKAKNPKSLPGVGQGTFPGQTHAFDKEGWYWQDLNGKWHHSNGISPTQPMFKAWQSMELSIKAVSKSVFGI